MVDFADTVEQASFRYEVAGFIDAHLPAELRLQDGDYMNFGEGPSSPAREDALKRWRAALVARGWIAPAWPKEYGGADLTPMEQFILNETFAEQRAPRPGVHDVGSTILVHGSDEQKREHLPPLVRGDTVWCQGYSEPGSGSDLASLQTRAVRDGDDFVVNGQKIWTSNAHNANWMFALVRTNPEAPKHRGITYLLLRMDSPGITVRPLQQMHGGSGFNEVFFEDVRVPARNAVGEIDRGWYVGATHLDFERSSIGSAVLNEQTLDVIRDFLVRERDADTGRSRLGRADSPRLQLADRYIEAAVARAFSQRIISLQARGIVPNYEASVTKMFGTELGQRIWLTATRLLGKYGDLFDPESKRTAMGGGWARMHLRSIAFTIEGGTSEIQRNVIATRGLGLPRG